MSAAPRQYEAIVALIAANDVKDDAIRLKMDTHDALDMKHREAGRALAAKHRAEDVRDREAGDALASKRDALHTELRANAADKRALQAEKVARCAQNARESMYQTGDA